MPQKSGFFDSTADDSRLYPAREFAEYFAQFIGNGIFKGGTNLKVSANGKDSNVSIAVGRGWINGYIYSVYDAPLVLPIKAATDQDRIDRVVLRLDVSKPVRAIKAVVLQGNAAPQPVAPSIVRSGDIYDLSLAQIRVKANTTVIAPDQVTDERLNNQVCGVVTGVVQQADTTAIFNEFQSWLNTKTAEYQKQWTNFMKSVQDEGFASTEYVDQKVEESKSHTHTAEQLPKATLTEQGITQLSNATNSTATDQAATPAAVKAAMDRANEAFRSASNGKAALAAVIGGVDSAASFEAMKNKLEQIKAAIAAAITGKGVATDAGTEFTQMATNINAISTGRRTATASVTFNSETVNTSVSAIIPDLGFTPTIAVLRNVHITQFNNWSGNAAATGSILTLSTLGYTRLVGQYGSGDITLAIAGNTLTMNTTLWFRMNAVTYDVLFIE